MRVHVCGGGGEEGGITSPCTAYLCDSESFTDGHAPTLVEALMKQVYCDPEVNPHTTAVVIGPS